MALSCCERKTILPFLTLKVIIMSRTMKMSTMSAGSVLCCLTLMTMSIPCSLGTEDLSGIQVPMSPATAIINNDTNYIPGFFSEVVTPSPVFYDTFLPVVYEFEMPEWTVDNTRLHFWNSSNNCAFSSNISEGYPCPVMHFMNGIIENIVANLTLWSNLKDNSSGVKSQFESSDYDCNQIRQHFTSFYLSQKELDLYSSQVQRKCLFGLTRVKGDKLVYDLSTMYHSPYSSFSYAYYKNDLSAKGQIVSEWTALQIGLVTHQFLESQRWASALESCVHEFIPYSLISQSALMSNVVQNLTLLGQLEKKGYQLSIPEKDASLYFKLALVNCAFVNKRTFAVRILLPLQRTGVQYQLVRYNPIPFLDTIDPDENSGTTGSSNSRRICFLDGLPRKPHVRITFLDRTFKLTDSTCNTNAFELCQTNSGSDDTSSSDRRGVWTPGHPCIDTVKSGSLDLVPKQCNLKCIDVSQDQFPIIITSPHLLISGRKDKLDVRVDCDNPGSSQLLPFSELGAWNVSFPCNCRLFHETSNRTYNLRNGECGSVRELKLTRVLPLHWRGSTSSGAGRKSVSDEDVLAQLKMLREQIVALNAKSQDSNVTDLINDKCGRVFLHQIVLWGIIVLLAILVGFLCFVVYGMHKHHRQERFRMTRLIYNDPSTSEVQEELF